MRISPPLRKDCAWRGETAWSRAMRFAVLFVLVLLAGCAAGPAGPTVPKGPAPPTRGRPAATLDPATALAKAGRLDAPSIAEALAMFGKPDVERRDGAGALLTWRAGRCALILGFASERLQTAIAGPPRTGEAAPALAECIAAVRSRIPVS
jgi:hypothetical protein